MIDNVTKEEEKVLTQKLVQRLINDPRTNAWEKDFLASVSSHLLARGLSEKQLSVLRKMGRKYIQTTLPKSLHICGFFGV